jgi:hypothetical protein
MPFQQAVNFLGDMMSVQVSKAQVVRQTEAAGAAYVSMQNEQADRIEREAPEALPGSDQLVMSADGAMVPLRDGEWAEVKTLAIGEVQPAVIKQKERVVRTRYISYFSRLVNAEQFERLTLVEMHRRGIEKSRQVAAVMDGADWLQSFVTYHRPDAVRILDFAHAGQRIGQVGQALFGQGTPEANQWSSQRLHQLKHEGPQEILVELRQLHQQHPQLEILAENLAYLEKREVHMQYPSFQEQGWPIGSGMVESGNKLVVEARLKGAGMHWKRCNVNSMLGLRNIVCSDRWIDEWPLIVQQLRRQAGDRRNSNRQKRRLSRIPEPSDIPEAPLIEEIVEPPMILPKEKAENPEKSGPRKPAANHPWRNYPIGRARYTPSKAAKN